MLQKASIGAIADSYIKQLPPASQLFFSQDMEIWSNPFNGGRRSYDGRTTPQYGDTVGTWSAGVHDAPGYQLQFQVQQFFEGNGHKLEFYIGSGAWGNGTLVMTLTAAGDSGSGVTMLSPWTTVPQSAFGAMTIWDTFPSFVGDAHFKQESIWWRYAPRV